jgi:amino acid transporter
VSEGQPAEQSAPAAVWRWLIGPPLRARDVSKERITQVEGLPALSLDALTSVAYGPEAIIVVLAVAGASALHLVLPITITIVPLLAILVFSYRQVIDAYPNGGGAYAVSRANLGHGASLAAAALVVDYTLTVAVSIAAGVAALTSAFPVLTQDTVVICLVILALVTVLNLRGLGDAARAFLLPTMVFIVGLLTIIVIGLIHPLALNAPLPGVPLVPRVPLETVSVLLLLKAFSAGCSALTGVEAIANGVPQFKEPRVKRAKRTEMLLGTILGVMLLGLAVLAEAKDHYLPHLFSLRDDRQVFAPGIWTLSILSAVLLIAVRGNVLTLIPLFAIGVFTGFTLSQSGLVVHWWRTRPPRWEPRAALNGLGATVTAVATVVFIVTKFTEGAFIDQLCERHDKQIVVLIPVALPGKLRYEFLHNHYDLVLSAALRGRPDVVCARVSMPLEEADGEGPTGSR